MKTKHILIVTFVSLVILSLIFFFPSREKAIKRVENTPMSAKEFETIMLSNNYIVNDIRDYYESYSYIESAYLASNDNFNIEFYIFDTPKMAYTFLNMNKMHIENNEVINSFSAFNGELTDKFINDKDDLYQVLSRIENTVIVINSTKDYKEEIDNILKVMKY